MTDTQEDASTKCKPRVNRMIDNDIGRYIKYGIFFGICCRINK
jgi:hypothetical protein